MTHPEDPLKYSGTLDFRRPDEGLQAVTIDCLAHFILHHTAIAPDQEDARWSGAHLLSDVQGRMMQHAAEEEPVTLLHDPMFHTLRRQNDRAVVPRCQNAMGSVLTLQVAACSFEVVTSAPRDCVNDFGTEAFFAFFDDLKKGLTPRAGLKEIQHQI